MRAVKSAPRLHVAPELLVPPTLRPKQMRFKITFAAPLLHNVAAEGKGWPVSAD